MRAVFIVCIFVMGALPSFGQAEMNLLQLDSAMQARFAESDFVAAASYAEKGAARSAAMGRDSTELLFLNYLGYLQQNQGEYKAAENAYMRALALAQRIYGPEDGNTASLYNNLGMLYHFMGNYPAAERDLLKALELHERAYGRLSIDCAADLDNLGLLYQDIGKYAESEAYHLEAISIAEKTNQSQTEIAVFLSNLSLLYRKTNRLGEAINLQLRVNKIATEQLGNTHPYALAALHNLAFLYSGAQKYDKAEELMLQVIALNKQQLGAEHLNYAAALGVLGDQYAAQKRYDEADKLYREVYAIYLKKLPAKHPRLAGVALDLAALYLARQQPDSALFYCKKSFMHNSDSVGGDFGAWAGLDSLPFLSDEHANRAMLVSLEALEALYLKESNAKSLISLQVSADVALRFAERLRNSFAAESDKLRILAGNDQFVQAAIRANLYSEQEEALHKAFYLAENSKAVLLMEATQSKYAYVFGDLPDSLVAKERNLQRSRAALQAKITETNDKGLRDSLLGELRIIHKSIQDFTALIEGKYPKYAALKYENKTPKVSEIQELMDKNMAIIEYAVTDSILYIFCIGKDSIHLEKAKITAVELERRAGELLGYLRDYASTQKQPADAFLAYNELAHWFYENVYPNRLKQKNKIKHILVVPDGPLAHLPFEIFLVEKGSGSASYKQLHYLLKDVSIGYNYSVGLWYQGQKQPKNSNNGKMLGIAAEYGASAIERASTRSLRKALGSLPAAKQEVEGLAAIFEGSFLFGLEASEKRIKAQGNDYSVVHLAMHGLLDKNNPMLSALAFTEDGDSLEDNFLRAYEISQMHLAADLVVLSACETGYGKFQKGNGTASLARAFMYAGAPSVIVSLWEVNDGSTAFIMNELYKGLSAGLSKAEALRQAKLSYLEAAPDNVCHPAFWSPFVQVGDNRSLALASKARMQLYYWLTGGAALALAVLWVFARFRRVNN